MRLGYDEEFLKKHSGKITAQEIEQQPRLWRETLELLERERESIEEFLRGIDLNSSKIIFTGAGTSEFVGNTLVPYLRETTGLDIESRATTDIVAAPKSYIPSDRDVVLVSFARSGNSPESVAAVEVAEKVSNRIHHIFITCNADGNLAKKDMENAFVLLMPKDSNDQGFAMTGSFSCMLLASYGIFTLQNLETLREEAYKLADQTEKNMYALKPVLENIVQLPTERVVFLGSGSLKGLAQETSLKVLELCAGDLSVTYDTPLGFRHGPKSVVNSKTLIFNFISQNPYKRNYDLDLVDELMKDKKAGGIITLHSDSKLEKTDLHLPVGFETENEVLKSLSYLIPCQMYSFMKSLHQNKTPDNPCPSGEVNRVVKGVVIHDYLG